jgi:hypothetical protein
LRFKDDDLSDQAWLANGAGDAGHFPVDVDAGSGSFFFRDVTRDSLSRPAFLDGRTPFWLGEGQAQPARPVASAGEAQATRLILHIGFCGSTLLASVLDQPGRALVLREPHILAAIAEQTRDQESAKPLLWKAFHLLSRRFEADEAVVIKPTNWFNSLAPLIAAAPGGMHPVFVTSTTADTLIAAFRGGNERITFLVRLAGHLAARVPQGPALWQQAAASDLEPLERAARIVLLARSLQHGLFSRAAQQGGWTAERWIGLAEVRDDLFGTASKVSRLLDLDLDRERLEQRCAEFEKRDAKTIGAAYSAERRRAGDEQLWSLHRARFEAAQRWAAETLADAAPAASSRGAIASGVAA